MDAPTATTKTNGHAKPTPGMLPTVALPGEGATRAKTKKKRARSAKPPAAARQSAAPATTSAKTRPLAVFLGNELAALGASSTTTMAQLDTFWGAMNDAWPIIKRNAA